MAVISFLFTACNKDKEPETPSLAGMEGLTIPADFDYSTITEIDLTISDYEQGTRYAIYSMTSVEEPEVQVIEGDTTIIIDNSNQLLAEGTVNGQWTVKLTVPAHQKYVYVKRLRDGGSYGENLEITNTQMSFSYSGSKSVADQTYDVLYGANGNGQAFSIDIETGESTLITTFEKGSNASAINKADNLMYVAEKSSPYRLRSIDLSTGEQTVIANLNKNFDRMAYDADAGLIYVGKGKLLYTYDPFSKQYINEYKLAGEYNTLGGGDVSIGEDGFLYFTSVSKTVLYKGQISGNKILLQTITSNLPEKSTSATIGSDGMLYYGTNTTPSRVYRVDLESGNAEFLYTLSNYRLNDLGMLKKDVNGGGSNEGGSIYTPGENIWGTLSFEDLWPSKGDYDFNDLVLNYNIKLETNNSNKVTSIVSKFKISHIGATLTNGFAFALPIENGKVSSVSGQNITDNAIVLNSNGTENGIDLAVIPVFDNAFVNESNEFEVVVTFTEPIDQEQLGAAPFNPFLIKNQDRAYEVHLSNMSPTSAADQAHLGTVDDDSDAGNGRYYKTDIELPWAINIPVEFVWPRESVEIIEGYLKFAEWAESGGEQYPDWYKDLDGYRDEANLDL
jgi:LruC domain-containing protein